MSRARYGNCVTDATLAVSKPAQAGRGRGPFAYSAWDAIPAFAGVAQFGYVLLLIWAFPRLHWWVLLPLGLVYSVSISWNINGISHNFLHNPFFKSSVLN